MNSLRSRLQAVLTDHVKIGPVTGIEVFKSAGTLVIEVQVPSQQPGESKSCVRISPGIEARAEQFILTVTDHQNLEASDREHRKPKLVSNGFRQLVPAKASTKRDCEFVDISKHSRKNLRHAGCHESDGAVRWGHVSTNMPRTEQTLYRDKEKWIDAFGRSTDEARLEYGEDRQ